MGKSTNVVALAAGAVAVFSIIALPVLSPVSAKSTVEDSVDVGSVSYLPAQVVVQSVHIEPLPEQF